jgi:hypothetical protein
MNEEVNELHRQYVIKLKDENEKQKREIARLHRVIAKELTENDELGCEYTYVNALREDCRRLRLLLWG